MFVRRDAFERFVSALIFVPRDHYNTQLRQAFQSILEQAFNGKVTAYFTQMSDSVLARLHVIIATTRGEVPDVDIHELEGRLVEAGRSWTDKLHEELIETKGEGVGNKLFRHYGQAFPTSYREAYHAHAAVFDIERMEDLEEAQELAMNLYRPIGAEEDVLHLKIFIRGRPVPLSDVMPMLENMGVKVLAEVPFEISGKELTKPIWMHDF